MLAWGTAPVLGQCWSSIGPVLAQCIGPVLARYRQAVLAQCWGSNGSALGQYYGTYWPSAGPVPVQVLAWYWPSTGKVHRRVNVPLLVQYIIVSVWDSNKNHDMKQNEINFIETFTEHCHPSLASSALPAASVRHACPWIPKPVHHFFLNGFLRICILEEWIAQNDPWNIHTVLSFILHLFISG